MSSTLPGLFSLMIGMWIRRCSPADVADLERLVESLGGEVTFLLVSVADALFVFFELGGIEGRREQFFEEDRMRNPDGVQVLHRANHLAPA